MTGNPSQPFVVGRDKENANAPQLLAIGYFVIIVLLVAGGLGGSYQPARVALAAIFPFSLLSGIYPDHGAPFIRQALRGYVLILLLSFISLTWSQDLAGGFGLVLAMTVGMSTLPILGAVERTVVNAQLIERAWVLMTGLSLMFAFYEITTGNHFAFAFESRNEILIGDAAFASVFFGNYNDYSVVLCLCIPFIMSQFSLSSNIIYRAILSVILFSTYFVIVVNSSRMAMACSVILLIYFLLFVQRYVIFTAFMFSLLAMVVAAFVAIDFYALYDFIGLRFSGTLAGDESSLQRAGIISAGLNSLRESWGLGLGAGGFEEYMNDNYPYFVPNPHNLILEMAVNFGAAAAVVFLWILLNIMRLIYVRTKSGDSKEKAIFVVAVGLAPFVGIIGSQAVGYTYWWVWLSSVIFIAACRSPSSVRRSAGA
jgi:teichuronic acid biosynthesis protein TuaE